MLFDNKCDFVNIVATIINKGFERVVIKCLSFLKRMYAFHKHVPTDYVFTFKITRSDTYFFNNQAIVKILAIKAIVIIHPAKLLQQMLIEHRRFFLGFITGLAD